MLSSNFTVVENCFAETKVYIHVVVFLSCRVSLQGPIGLDGPKGEPVSVSTGLLPITAEDDHNPILMQ